MDVGAALAFEEKGEPEGEGSGEGWVQRVGWALGGEVVSWGVVGGEGGPVCSSYECMEAVVRELLLTPKSSRASRRWRGMTVTCSISARKPTSLGVSPAGRGRAMAVSVCAIALPV